MSTRNPPNTNNQDSDHEDDADHDTVRPAPQSGEDRKAAAALSALDCASRGDDMGAGAEVDQEALGEAMKNLGGAAVGGAAAGRKKVRVDAGDVMVLVEELELSKVRATELLRSHDGDLVTALREFVTPP